MKIGMRKTAVAAAGLLCLAARGASPQPFERQVLQTSQEASDAALQMRRDMASSQAPRGGGSPADEAKAAGAARTAPTVKVVSDFTRRPLFWVREDARPIVYERLIVAGLLPVKEGPHRCRLSQSSFDSEGYGYADGRSVITYYVSVELSCQSAAGQWVMCFSGQGGDSDTDGRLIRLEEL